MVERPDTAINIVVFQYTEELQWLLSGLPHLCSRDVETICDFAVTADDGGRGRTHLSWKTWIDDHGICFFQDTWYLQKVLNSTDTYFCW